MSLWLESSQTHKLLKPNRAWRELILKLRSQMSLWLLSHHTHKSAEPVCACQELDVKPQELDEERLEGSVSRPGLLAKALQPPGLANRAVSLLNLLDQPPPAAQMQAPPTVCSGPYLSEFRAQGVSVPPSPLLGIALVESCVVNFSSRVLGVIGI